MKLSVRRAGPSDVVTLQRLNADLFAFEERCGFYENTYDVDWPWTTHGEQYFGDLVDASNAGAAAFLAFHDDQPAGYLAASVNSPPYRQPTCVATLDNMFVVEHARRSGVGRTLVDEFRKWARESGATRLRVSAFSGNDAVGFYESCGFNVMEATLETDL